MTRVLGERGRAGSGPAKACFAAAVATLAATFAPAGPALAGDGALAPAPVSIAVAPRPLDLSGLGAAGADGGEQPLILSIGSEFGIDTDLGVAPFFEDPFVQVATFDAEDGLETADVARGGGWEPVTLSSAPERVSRRPEPGADPFWGASDAPTAPRRFWVE